MDDSGKEFIDLLKHLILDQLTGPNDEKKKAGSPSVIGVKFVMGGGSPSGLGSFGEMPKLPKRQLPLELFEDDTTYILQTELPGSCTEFTIEFSDGKLHLKTGHENEYSAEIPLSPIVPEKTESHLRNGVLEIVCYKQQQ
ncbi:MAG TPA: Hsp20/alpha crystallin family protein [Methanocorpusculum sp.]|nr:Hsp20/alpha crystallin family protein [Methanocorpusculum sp.]